MSGVGRLFEAARGTLTGKRPLNQDRCLFLGSPETLLLGLADGLGGHPRGEIAAQLFVDASENLFRQLPKPLFDPENFMLQCIGKAHSAIMRFGRRQKPVIAPRTTAVLAVIQEGVAYWAHVGDSRLYLIRDGEVYSRTHDHTQVRYVRQSETEASRPRASLTRCLGGLPQPPTTTCGQPTALRPGDTLLLCSDGLWGQVTRQALVDTLSNDRIPLQHSLTTLIDQASRVDNSDNVSAVALRWLAESTTQNVTTEFSEKQIDPQLERAIAHLNEVIGRSEEPK
ncbi:MAG: serine/threonine-protein phosphatase [Gammaproteobacteria bacterium]|nr:serine/threonine-protein phosphatase [Gammaproteobacteria bacterium]